MVKCDGSCGGKITQISGTLTLNRAAHKGTLAGCHDNVPATVEACKVESAKP